MAVSSEDVRAKLESGRHTAAEALRGIADQLEAVPLDHAAEVLVWLQAELASFVREAGRVFRGANRSGGNRTGDKA